MNIPSLLSGNITYGDNYSHINVEAAFSESDLPASQCIAKV